MSKAIVNNQTRTGGQKRKEESKISKTSKAIESSQSNSGDRNTYHRWYQTCSKQMCPIGNV